MAVSGIIGIKLGMTQVYADDGTAVPCTVLQAGPCVVVQRRTKQKDGYDAVQLGSSGVRVKPQSIGQAYDRAFQEGRRGPDARAARSSPREESADEAKAGDRVLVDGFTPGEFQ